MVAYPSLIIALTYPLVMFLAGCVVEDATPEVVDVFPAAPEPATATSETDFVRATITRLFSLPDTEGNNDLLLDQPVVTVVDHPETVAKLAAFFPGAGKRKKSKRAGGWIAYATIKLERTNGETITVIFDPQFELWTEHEQGLGDWPLDPDFRPYFISTLKASEAAPPTEEAARYKQATIERFYSLEPNRDNRQHLAEPVVTVVDDPQTVAKLASFFDGMGEGKESDLAAGWEEFAQITFLRSSGDEAPVSVSFTLEEWSEGQGDWPLPEQFETYFLKLLRANEPGQP